MSFLNPSRPIALPILAAVLVLAAGCSGYSSDEQTVDKVPEVVFDGGAGTIGVTFDVNQPSRLVASFSQYDEMGDRERSVSAVEKIAPGSHTKTIDVSPGTYVYLELGVPDASVGATANWVVTLDGREVYRESDRLGEPLRDGYAFFLQFEADDVDQIRSWVR